MNWPCMALSEDIRCAIQPVIAVEFWWSPISCTLLYSSTEAVLVDTPITVSQTQNLIKWIEDIAPNRKLRYIYISLTDMGITFSAYLFY